MWRRRAQPVLLALGLVGIAGAATVITTKLGASRSSAVRAHLAAAQGRAPAFDLSNATIPPEAIRRGGPPKDGIPALTDPSLVAAADADFLGDDDEVIGVDLGGESVAYPLRVLDYHEIVNDIVGGHAIAVTYCPLCDSSAVFDRSIDGEQREFGVSGMLYNSNVLLYDRQEPPEESLWSQMGAAAVSGPSAGLPLESLPLEVVTWASWRARHPDTRVLSIETGHTRTYDRSVYARYFQNEQLMFPVEPLDDRLSAKSRVLYVQSGGDSVAYPNPGGIDPQRWEEALGEATFDLVSDQRSGSLRIENVRGEVSWRYTFWFACAAFAPNVRVEHRP